MPNPPPKPDLESVLALECPPLVDRYAGASARFDRRVLDLSDEQQDLCFRPEAGVGRWSCRMLVGHVADADLVFTHRMRRAVAEEGPVVAEWDENAFIDSGLYASAEAGGGGADRPLAGSVALIHTLRLWTADWLRTLAPAQWDRRLMHPSHGPQTVKAVCARATWHLEHHAWFLAAKVERLLNAD
ncbi:MAG TPA: hypothetical protein DEB06_00815 [Phycisphaerales bacterium]|nr:hypothetical protein [Phycisphaerales bacterium]